MIGCISPAISRHRVFSVYLLSLLWLSMTAMAFALVADRPFNNALLILILVCGTILTYVLAWSALVRKWPALRVAHIENRGDRLHRMRHVVLIGLVLLQAAVVIAHFSMIGSIPLVDASSSASDLDVSVVRQKAYFDLPFYMRYASDYTVKALGPALLLLTYYFRSRLFWIVLAIGCLYSVSLFARILPVVLVLPLLAYQLMQRRWLHLAAVFLLMAFMVAGVTAISSIALRESVVKSVDKISSDNLEVAPPPPGLPLPELKPTAPDDWRRTSILYALYERMLVVPGQVMDQWFHYYQEPGLREQGCGYRLLAPLLECKSYVHVPTKLYSAYYRDNVGQGLRGSLNAASFMTEFANFGPAGFILSALLAGMLFVVVKIVYQEHPLALPMNIPLIVSAMESNLFTAVNSGAGWLVMTLIFIIFFRLSPK